jgi:hypothetical protein
MKLGYPKLVCSQRNKDETIISVIKRLFGELLMYRLIRTRKRSVIQMHSLRHAKINQPYHTIDGFYEAHICLEEVL